VVVPAASGGELFFEEGARVFPEFIVKLLEDFKAEGGKFHIAGMSNGGLSAFHIAAMYPECFLSATGFPRYLIDRTPGRVKALSGICLNYACRGIDPEWAAAMKQQSEQPPPWAIEQPHRLETLAGDGAARLFNQFDEAQHGCRQAK
jgi:pimeloyl-ACP methyl ester carboxylesterase